MEKKEIVKIIREIMLVNLEIDAAMLADEDKLHGGELISLDSMEFMELAFSLEQKFDVPFDEEMVELPKIMVSLSTIADYIYESLQAKLLSPSEKCSGI